VCIFHKHNTGFKVNIYFCESNYALQYVNLRLTYLLSNVRCQVWRASLYAYIWQDNGSQLIVWLDEKRYSLLTVFFLFFWIPRTFSYFEARKFVFMFVCRLDQWIHLMWFNATTISAKLVWKQREARHNPQPR